MRIVFALLMMLAWPAAAAEPLKAESYFVEKLGSPTPHWVLVNDMNFTGMTDGKVYAYDAAAGTMLGMMSTGYAQMASEIAPDFSAIYVPITFYSRGTYGDRTDAVVIYETESFTPVAEVVIPPKRATGMPMRGYSGMSDDGRFVYVVNMTPATSISIVNVADRTFATEVDTAGCALVFPTGNRSFASLCGDGTVQSFMTDDSGKVTQRKKSVPFFAPNSDPVTEKASRHGDAWLFFSFDGFVHPVKFAQGMGTPQDKWSLFTDAERAAGWKVGGSQFNTVHNDKSLLFVIVHQGGTDSHKDPGSQVWVYDLAKRTKLRTIELASHAMSIAVTKDPAPLLVATTLEIPALWVYDAMTGALKHTIEGGPMTPSFSQVR